MDISYKRMNETCLRAVICFLLLVMSTTLGTSEFVPVAGYYVMIRFF